jgi:hypothetical protein
MNSRLKFVIKALLNLNYFLEIVNQNPDPSTCTFLFKIPIFNPLLSANFPIAHASSSIIRKSTHCVTHFTQIPKALKSLPSNQVRSLTNSLLIKNCYSSIRNLNYLLGMCGIMKTLKSVKIIGKSFETHTSQD